MNTAAVVGLAIPCVLIIGWDGSSSIVVCGFCCGMSRGMMMSTRLSLRIGKIKVI